MFGLKNGKQQLRRAKSITTRFSQRCVQNCALLLFDRSQSRMQWTAAVKRLRSLPRHQRSPRLFLIRTSASKEKVTCACPAAGRTSSMQIPPRRKIRARSSQASAWRPQAARSLLLTSQDPSPLGLRGALFRHQATSRFPQANSREVISGRTYQTAPVALTIDESVFSFNSLCIHFYF